MTLREKLMAMLEVSDDRGVTAAEASARIGTSRHHANDLIRALREEGLVEPAGAEAGVFRWRLVAPAKPQHVFRDHPAQRRA